MRRSRALDGKRKANDKPAKRGPDSLELWTDVLRDLCTDLKLSYGGLLVRAYSNDVATEEFAASRREVTGTDSWQEALTSLNEGELVIFRE